VGGIIPADDAALLRTAGVAAIYTPKDYELTRLIGDIADIVADHATTT
jgi:(2R)-ethylmalonyl-CoA mutase